MDRSFVLLICVVAVTNAAPYYTTTLVESPTSRFEQRLILSPQLHETYRIRPQHVIPYQRLSLRNPHPELVYYHGQQQNAAPQYSMNLYGLRQDSPFWQEWFNRLVEQTAEGDGQSSDEASGFENFFQSPTEKPELESQSTEEPTDLRLGEEESNKIAPKEETTTTAKPIDEDQQPLFDDTVVVNSADQSSTTEKEVDSLAETINSADQSQKVEPQTQTVSSTTAPLEEYDSSSTKVVSPDQPIKFEPLKSSNEIVNRDPLQAPLQQIFTHNQRYYIVSGPPQFYENFDARAPIFSLQELLPVKRTFDNAQAEKIAQFSMPSTEPTSTLRINVVDEDETEESARDNDGSEHIRPRSQRLLSDDQNTEKEGKMSSKEEKREQSDVEGESRCFKRFITIVYN